MSSVPMANSDVTPKKPNRSATLRGIAVSLVINAALPIVIYALLNLRFNPLDGTRSC
jgi:hypothetical protein